MASMDLITTELYQARVTQYGMAAGVTLVFYDIVLNIPKESILIWKSAPSLPKYVYFLSRYPVPLAYIAQIYIDGGFSTTPLSNQLGVLRFSHQSISVSFFHRCHAYWIWIVFFAFFEGFALGGCLIVLRVYVLYKAVRYSGILFTLLWIINWLPSTVAMAVAYGTWYTLDNENMIYLSIPGLCAPTDRPPWIWVLWICPIFFQSIVCGLLLYKFRENRHLQAGQYSGSLMSCLIRDGLLYNVTLLGYALFVRLYRGLGDIHELNWEDLSQSPRCCEPQRVDTGNHTRGQHQVRPPCGARVR
ncbi:hypothetical protein CALCODRAFT_179111 [Calocera cornea HHB12733]|uniref:DUF6533 domain-containing protein n=1 Tax=Calocera cornea HHB12733 TaxID=1353952 RepID=A0A165CD67_9BASI|nr:hypothetical protein CALCODRAFT_179111 [Calocera cornea HHB12733]